MTVTEVGGMHEEDARAIFAGQATFVLGCQMASVLTDTFLGAVLAMQAYHYFLYQRGDRFWTRAIVIHVLIMNITVTVYYWAFTQYLMVQHFGEWLPWLEVRWLENMPVIDVLCVSVVQGFFAYRAFLLTHRNWSIYILLNTLIVTAFAGGIGVKIIFGKQSSLLGASKCGPALITWLVATTAVDVLTAASILWGLWHSKSGWAHTDKLVSRLIRITFEAQLPPTILAIAYLAEWLVNPSSLLGALFQALQCKAYSVGLLFALNARVHYVIANPSYDADGAQVFGMATRVREAPLEIAVDTETWVHHDPSDGQTNKDADSASDIGREASGIEYDNTSQSRLTTNPA